MPIGQNTFTGVVPGSPSHLLPDTGAQNAENCDFAHGELRALKADKEAIGITAGVNPIVSMFGDIRADGRAVIYCWGSEADAVRNPVLDDTHQRYYYTLGGVLYVHASGSHTAGQTPSGAYKAGCPSLPTIDTTVSGVVNRAPRISAATVSNLSRKLLEGLTASVAFWWESDGKKLQTASPSLTTLSEFKYKFTAPALTQAVMTPVAFTITGWRGTDGVVHMTQDEPTIAMGSLEIHILSATSVNSGFGIIDSTAVTSIFDVNKVERNLAELCKTKAKEQGLAVDAKPVVEFKFRDTTKGVDVFVLYSSNSEFIRYNNTALIPGGVSLLVEKVAGTELDYTIEFKLSASEQRSYVATLVNIYGVESAPTDPVTIDVNFFQDVNVTLAWDPALSAFTGYAPIKNIRIYRTLSAANGATDFLLTLDYEADQQPLGTFTALHAVPAGNYTWRDSRSADQLSYAMPTDKSWTVPPSGLTGLRALETGALAAFTKNKLYITPPNYPDVWPELYAVSFANDIVAFEPFGGGGLVWTKGGCFSLIGVAQDIYTARRVQGSYGSILSRFAVAVTDLGVVFATDDGLAITDGNEVRLDASQRFMTRADWKTALAGQESSLRLVWNDGYLLGYFVGVDRGFMLRIDEASWQLTWITGLSARCHFRLMAPESLWLAKANKFYEAFADTTSRALVYKTRKWLAPKAVNFGAIQVLQDGTSTVKVFCDAVERYSQSLTGDSTVRLPSEFKGRGWEVQVSRESGQPGAVRSVHLGNSKIDLGGV